MKTIVIDSVVDSEHLLGEFLTDDHYDLLIEESCNVYVKDILVAGVIKNCLPKELIRKTWPILKKIKAVSSLRGMASGHAGVVRTKKDGTVSKTTAVPKDYQCLSSIIGYYDRYPRTPYCRKCAWNEKHPELFEELKELFVFVSETQRRFYPDSFALLNSFAAKTNPDFIVKDSVYTTATVNHNFRTAAHRDAKNLHEGLAPMIVLRSGSYSGGHLVFPEIKKAFKLDTGDIIFFRNETYIHGNTRIMPLSEKYDRCSVIFYYRHNMYKCGSEKEELLRAKRRKEGDPLY
jgi:hypothetical protein